MSVKTAWLKPTFESGGLDHLGIQQTPIRIFSSLLPGLTVVTDRVACYSFYPWLAWVYSEEEQQIGLDFITTLRRAECLHTLIAEHHAIRTGEHIALHSRGLVGRFTLTPSLSEDAPRPIPLAKLAAIGAGSYFKNRYGGLGQYYLGPLRELRVLDLRGGAVECSEDIGVPLARAFEQRVDRADFLRVIRKGVVTDRDLERLVPFCPCGLAAHAPERDALIDLLLARKGTPDESDRRRRETFTLLLDLAARRSEEAAAPLELAFLAACLAESLDDGAPWPAPAGCEQTRRAWAVYERCDELAVAVLGVFWVALRLLDERGGAADSIASVGALVRELARKAVPGAGRSVRQAVAACLAALPPLSRWTDSKHEFQRALEVGPAARRKDTAECLRASAEVLMALAARHSSGNPYLDVAIPSDYLSYYPLNLVRFRERMDGDWGRARVADWLGDVASSWGLEAHLRVALRKLNGESIDTFLAYATEDGIRRREGREPPRPGFTASRVDRAVRFLVDLGLARWDMREAAEGADEEDEAEDASQGWVARITPLGREVLGGLHA